MDITNQPSENRTVAKGSSPRKAGLTKKRLLLAAAAPTLLLLLGVFQLWPKSQNPPGLSGQPDSSLVLNTNRPSAPDFVVITTEGSPFRLSEQRGNVRILFFTGPG